jgi:hypothetical protein
MRYVPVTRICNCQRATISNKEIEGKDRESRTGETVTGHWR